MRHLLPIVTLLVAVASALSTLAQCPAAVNVSAQSGACDIRLTWSNLPGASAAGLWNVYRSTTPSLTGATLITTRGGGTHEYTDTPPDQVHFYYYFIQAVGPTPACPTSGFVAAPVSARLGEVQAQLTVTTNCGVIDVSWPPLSGAISHSLYRETPRGGIPTRIAYFPFPAPGTTTFSDDEGVAGDLYTYILHTETVCGAGITGYSPQTTMTGMPAVSGNLPPVIVAAGTNYTIPFSIDLAYNTPTASRWFKDGQPLQFPPEGRLRLVDAQRIAFSNVQPDDTGLYRVELTFTCGTLSQEMLLAVRPAAPACPADFNNSGDLSVQDVFDFLSAYFAGCP